MSFKAYPTTWAYHDAMRAAAARWQRHGLLLPAQQAAIEAAYPVDYYRPSPLLRVGLFVATLLSVGSLLLALGISCKLHDEVVLGALTLVGSLVAAELFIKGSRHYHSGVDTALLYSALLAWQLLVFHYSHEPRHYEYTHRWWLAAPSAWQPLLWLLGVLLVALVRYADPVVAIVAFGTGLALLFNGLLHVGAGQWLLPFGVMGVMVGLLFGLEKLPRRADYSYYRSSSLVLRTLALAVFYLAGNYFVVREGYAALLNHYGLLLNLPLAPLHYVLTAVVPLLYLYLGLRRHDRLLLGLGVLAVAFSIFTVRYYHALLPPELAATLAGLVLMGLALAALRYLRTPRHGFTAAADEEAPPRLNLEALVVAHTAHVPAAATPGFEFGGGRSGGGGAEAQW